MPNPDPIVHSIPVPLPPNWATSQVVRAGPAESFADEFFFPEVYPVHNPNVQLVKQVPAPVQT